jgi:hypothetical protein
MKMNPNVWMEKQLYVTKEFGCILYTNSPVHIISQKEVI